MVEESSDSAAQGSPKGFKKKRRRKPNLSPRKKARTTDGRGQCIVKYFITMAIAFYKTVYNTYAL